MLQSGNPTLREDVFAPAQRWDDLEAAERKIRSMSLQGTINASLILLGICAATAVGVWGWLGANQHLMIPVFFGSMLAGLVLSLIICFKPRTAPFLAPVAAVFQGAFVAGASAFWTGWVTAHSAKAALAGQHLILHAGLLTFGIAAAMLTAYATRLIKPSQTLISGIVAATGGVCIFLVGSLVLSLFWPGLAGSIWSGWLGIGIAGVIVVVASMNLVVDFAMIEQGVENQAPKHMEWYGGFALMITLVWLYISLLRLLALLAANRE